MSAKRKPKVVLVDDERDYLALLESWLKPDHDVTSFCDAAAAAERIGEIDPDLVILDVRMPSGSGFDVCKWLRTEPAYAKLPILFLTGSRLDSDFLRHIRAGGSGYLTKPIDRKDFVRAVDSELARAAAPGA